MNKLVSIKVMTPKEYGMSGANLTLHYSLFPSSFGKCLVASTARGICMVIFCDKLSEGFKELRKRWPKAVLRKKIKPEHTIIKNYFSGLRSKSKIKLHLHGSPFQIKVWKALLTVPEGSTTTYRTIARQIGFSPAFQAVGGAVGDNPIAYLIPCHRVLKSTGAISGYRWGVERKRAMLSFEAIRKNDLSS